MKFHYTSVLGHDWPGYDNIKKLFIFGDSYSAVGYDTGWPGPTLDEPLGVPFPGYTWTEGGEENFGDSVNPNWVGHLVTERRRIEKPLIVYDYAVGGHTLDGVKFQIEDWFLPHVGTKPDWAPWTPEESLFATWIGINDCTCTDDYAGSMVRYFELQETLYNTGARNFLFIDVPPIHLSPAFRRLLTPSEICDIGYHKWNRELGKGILEFLVRHPDVTVLSYSSWNLFSRVIESPEAYGFRRSDLRKEGGSLWMDHIHPTSKMHRIIASDLNAFLDRYRRPS